MPGKEWAQETIDRLTELWSAEQRLSAAAIARRLGVSKNAVVGKAHRLDLPARNSPIIRADDGTPRRKPRRRPPVRNSLPPLPSALTAPPPAPLPPPAARGTAPAAPSAVVAPPPPPPPKPYGRVITCCWPIGEPGTRGFRFCDDLSLPGRPYCTEHARLAYVKMSKEDHLAFLPAA